jgi:hypothetical protein
MTEQRDQASVCSDRCIQEKQTFFVSARQTGLLHPT